MILEQHYDDAVLIGFLGDEPAARRDPHLITCRPCAETLATLRTMAEALEDETVWELRELDDTPRQSTIDTLRAKQREMATCGAREFVSQLEGLPREVWLDSAAAASLAISGDVLATELVAASDRSVFSSPSDALEFARIAANLAVASEVRSDALREYGYVLYYTGNLREALVTTDRAAALATEAQMQARLRLQRALIFSEMGRLDESREMASAAAKAFEQRGDRARYIAARRIEGIALHKLRRNKDALNVYLSLEQMQGLDEAARAGVLQAAGVCYRELGDFAAARRFFFLALDAFQRLLQPTMVEKTRWLLGRTLLVEGKYREALQILESVRDAARELGMHGDVALVTIDVAQILSVIGEPHQVTELCRTASEYFAGLGSTESEGALTALALIREAAASSRLTPEILIVARKHAETRPNRTFLFAPE
jgi:tetratricopeptide (TPR) repeat protein